MYENPERETRVSRVYVEWKIMDSYGSLSILNPGNSGEEEEEVPSPEDRRGSPGIPSSEENQESPEEEGIESLQGNEMSFV